MKPPDNVFKALADPTRRVILERLVRDGEQSVTKLTGHAAVSQPAVSKHLALLKRAGLVAERRDGRVTYYRAETKGLAPLIDWLGLYDDFWRDRFDRLEDLLKRMDQ
jgi:DNA-binding transcriptional ArsR family regulator